MKHRTTWILISILTAGGSLFSGVGAAAREDTLVLPLSNRQKQFSAELNTSFNRTQDNYIAWSQIVGLPGGPGSFFQYSAADFSLRHNPTPWLELEAFVSGFWFAHSANGLNNLYSNPNIQRGGGALRSQHKFYNEGAGLVPEFNVSFPFFALNDTQHTPLLDDRSWHITQSLWMYLAFKNSFYPFVQGGFKFRSHGLSSIVQWKGGGILMNQYASLGLAGYGFWSVIKDQNNLSFSNRIPLINRVNAGSLQFLSENPGVIGLMSWVGVHLPSYLTMRLIGDMNLNGTQYAKSFSVRLSLLFEMGTRRTRAGRLFKRRKRFHPSSNEFTPKSP